MKRTILAVSLVSAAILASASSFAKTSGRIEILSSTSQASVKYTGTTDNALMFDVNLDNPTADKFTVTVTTKDGDVLFSKDFSDKTFSKKFKLVKSDDISSYNFTITSANKNLEQTFVVDATVKTVDNVVVTKL
jgi:hypothetical protein